MTLSYYARHQLENIKLDPAIFGGQYNTPLVRYTYDGSGNRATRTVFSGAHADYDIDELNRVRAQANYFANGQMGRFDYGFDAMGRRRYEQRDWGTADGYQYDPSDEVTGYQRDGTLNGDGTVSASFWNNTGIQYDNNGNRTQVSGSGASSYAINNLNQYTSVSNIGGIGYDPKGNLTSASGWIYTYDAQNRLIRMENGGTVIVMTYDPLNRVITRAVNGAVTQNVWEGWNLIEEHRPDWSIQRCYLQGANQNEMVAAFDGGVYTTHWFWQDGRGNTSHITGDNAALLERYTYDLSGAPKFYDEWGNERLGGSVYDARFLFAGSQYLSETGLYDMRNRFYHIALNRFLQSDPIGLAGDALNLYRYCGNDPVDRSDPMGLEFTAEIELRPNLDNLPKIDPRQFGGTAGTLAVDARLVNGKIVAGAVDLHAKSYVRTYMRYSGEEKPRSKFDIRRTIRHEGKHLPFHEGYYKANAERIKADFQDGKSYGKADGERAIQDKKDYWQKDLDSTTFAKGTELHRRENLGFQRDSSPDGNSPTPSGTTGQKPDSAAAVEAALLELAFGVGGGQPGEGSHAPGRN